MVLTDPAVIKQIRQKFGFEFKKSFGQNFLTSGRVLDDICDATAGAEGVLEIGPGFGTLTYALAEKFPKVVAIELDSRLLQVLNYTLQEFDNVKIIEGDCMKLDLNRLINEEFGNAKVSVAANLPYYITTPVITTLLESKLPLERIVVMVQKEVAQRICATPGSKDYGAISVLCSYYTESNIVSVAPAACFVPPPKVDSAVVQMKLRKTPPIDVKDTKVFFSVVKAAFSQRRKTLCNCLCNTFHVDKSVMSSMLEDIDILPTRRGETLNLEEFAKISDNMLARGLI